MQCVIPCGGYATRLGNASLTTPKSMIDICGKPFLEYQVELLKKHNIKNIVLCVNHLKEEIEKYFGDGKKFGVSIKYSTDDNFGVIGAVKNAVDILEKIFFIMYGDSYLPYLDFGDMFQLFTAQDRLAMIAVWKNDSYIDKSNIKVIKGKIVSINDKNSKHIDYGVTIMYKNALWKLHNPKISTKDLREHLFKRNQLIPYSVTKRFYHIGNPEALEETKRFICEQK